MTHPNAIATADLPGMIEHHTAEYARLLEKTDANWYDWTFQNHHFHRARELQDEMTRRVRECPGLERVA